jgi:single-stranded DNA-binding protein
VVFGAAAEQTLRQHDKLYVEGALSLSEWTGRDGQKRTGLSVVASRVEAPTIGRNKPAKAGKQDDDAVVASSNGHERGREAPPTDQIPF